MAASDSLTGQVDAVTPAQGDHGAVHVVDFGRPSAQQILAHRRDISRRAEHRGDGFDEVELEA